MQITIFGASGSVGQLLSKEAERRGYHVIAVSRRKGSIKESSLIREKIVDYDNLSSLEAAIQGSQAVIISLGDYDVIQPTKNVIQAMKKVGVKRLEILTGFGMDRDSLSQLGIGMKTILKIMHTVMGTMLKNKIEQSRLVRESHLDFTNVQPPTLTFKEASGDYRHGDYRGKSIFGTMSRFDLVIFMLDNIDQYRYINQAVYVQS